MVSMPDYISPPTTLAPGSGVWGYLRDSGGDAQEQSVHQQKAELIKLSIEKGNQRFGIFFFAQCQVTQMENGIARRDKAIPILDNQVLPALRTVTILAAVMS
jgi:hypothetical protein